jgi:hypothetical protein
LKAKSSNTKNSGFVLKTSKGNDATLNDRLEKCKNELKFTSYIDSIIDEKGFSHSEVCRRGCIDNSNFTNLLNGKRSTIRKITVIKMAYGLLLTLDQTKTLLSKAGYSFDESDEFDTVIQYCLENRYSTFKTNAILRQYFDEILFDSDEALVDSDEETEKIEK